VGIKKSDKFSVVRHSNALSVSPVIANMTNIGGFEIKREEKYFVFIWLSRKERAVTEKMAHHPLFLCKMAITSPLYDSWPKTVFG